MKECTTLVMTMEMGWISIEPVWVTVAWSPVGKITGNGSGNEITSCICCKEQHIWLVAPISKIHTILEKATVEAKEKTVPAMFVEKLYEPAVGGEMFFTAGPF